MTATLRPHYLSEFRCLGADCEDTCCKGWSMQVDDATFARYQTKAPELLEAVTGESPHLIMKRDPQSDFCVKFTDGLCSIHAKYGETFLGDACNFFPRVTRALGEQTVMSAALSCPEIARLSLFHNDAFGFDEATAERLPQSLKNYLPQGLNETQAIAIHREVIKAALDETSLPEHNVMKLYSMARSLEKIDIATWPEAVPFYLSMPRLLPPEPRATDPFYLLQALCGLIAAAKKVHLPRLMETVRTMERALHVTINWENLALMPLPDSEYALRSVQEIWASHHAADYANVLRRYLAAQCSIALFPFGGFGNSMSERMAIIGIRFATIKLALMCAVAEAKDGKLAQNDCVRVVQSISRLLDHLSEPEFSLQIYNETGWLNEKRLRALVGDTE